LVNSLMPLSPLLYEEQLAWKEDLLRRCLRDAVRKLKDATAYARRPWLEALPPSELVCPFEGVVSGLAHRSHYRSKTEFTVGFNADRRAAVGFPLFDMTTNSQVIGAPGPIRISSQIALAVAASFQRFLDQHPDPAPFHKIERTGFWRGLVVRDSQRTGELMVILQVVAERYAADVVHGALERAAAHLLADFPPAQLVSLMWVDCPPAANILDPALPYQVLRGHPYYTEMLLGNRFHISPASFFQNNVPMAELLFTKAREWAAPAADEILFDVCCGTGVIGISLASAVTKVVGVDICEPAVRDATDNAQLNGITNCTFVAGPAEKELPTLIRQNYGASCCAIVDPARPGLHPTVREALRTCTQLKRLVYISCNPNAFVNDLAHLCRSQSRTLPGQPFRPVRACAFDMFPETEHVELLVLLERDE
jgi:tRNA (uracil-5-)-methyltransferase